MIIALHSQRARTRVCALLHRPIGYVWDWRRGPKAGFADVTDAEYARIKHLPGITKAQRRERRPSQLPLLEQGDQHVD